MARSWRLSAATWAALAGAAPDRAGGRGACARDSPAAAAAARRCAATAAAARRPAVRAGTLRARRGPVRRLASSPVISPGRPRGWLGAPSRRRPATVSGAPSAQASATAPPKLWPTSVARGTPRPARAARRRSACAASWSPPRAGLPLKPRPGPVEGDHLVGAGRWRRRRRGSSRAGCRWRRAAAPPAGRRRRAGSGRARRPRSRPRRRAAASEDLVAAHAPPPVRRRSRRAHRGWSGRSR